MFIAILFVALMAMHATTELLSASPLSPSERLDVSRGQIQCLQDIFREKYESSHDQTLLNIIVGKNSTKSNKIIKYLSERAFRSILMWDITKLNEIVYFDSSNILWILDQDALQSDILAKLIQSSTKKSLIILENSFSGGRIEIFQNLKPSRMHRTRIVILERCAEQQCACTMVRSAKNSCSITPTQAMLQVDSKFSFENSSKCILNVVMRRNEPFTVVNEQGELVGGLESRLLQIIAEKLQLAIRYRLMDESISNRFRY